MPLCSCGRRDFGGNVSVTEVAIIIVVETHCSYQSEHDERTGQYTCPGIAGTTP